MNPKNLHFSSKGRLKTAMTSFCLLSDDPLIVRAMIRLDIRNDSATRDSRERQTVLPAVFRFK
jgi:hypothetical protein